MTPYLQDPDVTLYAGDALEVLRTLPDRSVHMCATSPPFYGLRDYGTGTWEGGDEGCDHKKEAVKNRGEDFRKRGEERGYNPGSNFANYGERNATSSDFEMVCGKCGARRIDRQIGLEESPDEWVARLVEVFREVRRVLRDDGTLWVEIGDSYNGSGGYAGPDAPINKRRAEGDGWGKMNPASTSALEAKRGVNTPTCKPKDLLGQPWLLAFALRADGWYLRSEIIWARPNPMPESVTDRPTKAHSTVFLLSKQPRYYFDAEAIREPSTPGMVARAEAGHTRGGTNGRDASRGDQFTDIGKGVIEATGANARSVWTIPTEPTPFAHFATWPQKLVSRMILAGTSERGVCPECGGPWVREVEHADDGTRDTRNNHRAVAMGHDPRGPTAAWRMGEPRSGQTLGWHPSCGHDAEPVPAVVLDPFGGSGTTALVARKLHRRAVLCELNESYCELAAGRLSQQSLFAVEA